jgi:hypothetical protein
MGKVIEVNFGKKSQDPCSAQEPYREKPTEVVEVSKTEEGMFKTVAYVKVQTDFFHAMLTAMKFYGDQGFDHGVMAREILNWRMDK